MSDETPDFTKPLDVQAFFYNELGACGCMDLAAMIATVKDLLRWVSAKKNNNNRYDTLFGGNTGVFYLLLGLLDTAELCEYGHSTSYPWLTDKGGNLLKALSTFTADEIKNSEGVAYDGIYYVNSVNLPGTLADIFLSAQKKNKA